MDMEEHLPTLKVKSGIIVADGKDLDLRFPACRIPMNIMQRQFGPKTPRGEPRESHREISLGDHENSHGEILLVTMRYLTVRYLMVTKRYK